jgi:hypothetical protein
MMSQIDLTAALTDCGEASFLGAPVLVFLAIKAPRLA